jgi:PAS domain S-box-containing protein
MIENITESRQADRILAEERNLLRTLIDNLPDYIYVKDAESRFITGNIAVAQVMGASQVEALIGKTDADFYPQALANQFREDEIAVIESGRALINKEELLIDAEGNEQILSTTKVPLGDQQGQVIGLVGIGRDVTQRKQVENERAQLFAAVSRQREELRALAARQAEIQETERQHLARELHDKIGQNLTALGFNLNFLQLQLANPSLKLELIRSRLADSLTLVEQTADRIRDVMTELRPPMLDDYGLVDALDWYAEGFAKRMQLEVVVQADPDIPRLEISVENALFRIVQEALNNVAKHAQASQATISIKESNNKLRLVIADNGIGFDPAQQYQVPRQPSLGLLTMTERAEAVGALCRIETHPGQGTRVIVEVSQ